jgi:hypothetical protein
MKLSLDLAARVNLGTLVGLAECRTLADVKAAWELLDKLELSNSEKEKIEYQVQFVNGNEIPVWNREKTLPQVDVVLTDSEVERITKILGAARYAPGPMRRWLEPLLLQLPEF